MSLKRDTVYNFIGNLAPLLAAAIAIPYLLSSLGSEKFGILTLIWALIGYFGIFDLGVGRALTYEVSRRTKDHSEKNIKIIIKSGLTITFITGILGSLFVFFLIAPFGSKWFSISAGLQNEVTDAFKVIAFGIIPTTLTSGLRGVLEGFERFLEASSNRLILGTLMFLLPAISIILFGASLITIAIHLVAARYLMFIVTIFQLREYVFNKVSFNFENVKSLINFGSWITISGLISPLMTYGDRFFVSAITGAEALTFYAIPQEALQRLLIIPTAYTTSLMPRISKISQKKDEIIESYLGSLHKIAVIMFMVCTIAAFTAHPILSLWISEEFAQKSIYIIYILCIGLWFNSMSQLSITLLHATAKPKLVTIAHIIELILYVITIIVLSNLFGILGAAIAWTLRVTLDFILLHYLSLQTMKKIS